MRKAPGDRAAPGAFRLRRPSGGCHRLSSEWEPSLIKTRCASSSTDANASSTVLYEGKFLQFFASSIAAKVSAFGVLGICSIMLSLVLVRSASPSRRLCRARRFGQDTRFSQRGHAESAELGKQCFPNLTNRRRRGNV